MWEGVGANLQEVDKTKQALLLPAHYPFTLAFNMSSVLRKVSFHPYKVCHFGYRTFFVYTTVVKT